MDMPGLHAGTAAALATRCRAITCTAPISARDQPPRYMCTAAASKRRFLAQELPSEPQRCRSRPVGRHDQAALCRGGRGHRLRVPCECPLHSGHAHLLCRSEPVLVGRLVGERRQGAGCFAALCRLSDFAIRVFRAGLQLQLRGHDAFEGGGRDRWAGWRRQPAKPITAVWPFCARATQSQQSRVYPVAPERVMQTSRPTSPRGAVLSSRARRPSVAMRCWICTLRATRRPAASWQVEGHGGCARVAPSTHHRSWTARTTTGTHLAAATSPRPAVCRSS